MRTASRKIGIRSAALCAAAVLAACASRAAVPEPAPGPAEEADTPSGVLEEVALAYRLAEVGRRERSPLELLAAARILIRAGVAVESEDSAASPLRPGALLREARTLGGDVAAIRQLVQALEGQAGSTARGATEAPRVRQEALPAAGSREYAIRFRAGERAEVRVSAGPGLPLRCAAADSGGQVVASQAGNGTCVLRWVPPREQPYRIRVESRARTAGTFLLLHN
jgi:hypothetical protein